MIARLHGELAAPSAAYQGEGSVMHSSFCRERERIERAHVLSRVHAHRDALRAHADRHVTQNDRLSRADSSSLMRCSSAEGGLLLPTAAVPRRISVPSSRSIRIVVCVASSLGFVTIGAHLLAFEAGVAVVR